LTTNAGSEIYKTIAQYGESNSEKDMAIIAKKYDKLIRRSLSETSGDNRFPPELIGRIDVMVPFQPLSRHDEAP
jgi:ATP-dependent Clp protease ATP-binding subunit ClpA